jgi:hypothetical protein
MGGYREPAMSTSGLGAVVGGGGRRERVVGGVGVVVEGREWLAEVEAEVEVMIGGAGGSGSEMPLSFRPPIRPVHHQKAPLKTHSQRALSSDVL